MNSCKICIIIGGQRCASTSLYKFITSAFGNIGSQTIFGGEVEPKLLLNKITREDYLRNFRGHLLVDKSTSYFDHPRAADNAFQIVPDAKIVAILRNPVARAISHWMFSYRNGFETKSLREIVEDHSLQERPYNGVSVSPFRYLDRGYYVKHLKRWAQYFPNKSIKIYILEEIRDGVELLEGLGDFLEVRNDIDKVTLTQRDLRWNVTNSGAYVNLCASDLSFAQELLRAHYNSLNQELEDFLSRRIAAWG